ncbi:hypothetical protein BTO15_05120 [Polaribacter sejongensis]|uniref:RagB/SusD family nutrient uptake outer membrane protein n=1 Tax=Polaribacter sejongensis TaxID=985043 RepID=A0AAJ1QUN0_9FLAO|nr:MULTISPECIES: RagB/SusD family nutrient uptake outer membrane protein [Polaribacter]AUC21521.1 hypothetical protein BTO15_05120 [Polaribacter sejongensis]MDN3618136.1 RagB/SusD family nutrient uptake outer membrane protein [Polaribacter undariae]UWD30874.1 RagB/SusD family nutrient uptake outer membrane protein [Polaribacter undariae]
MKINKYIGVLLIVTLFFSCEAYLDKEQDFEGLQEEDVFGDILTAKYFLDGAYGKLITDVSAKGNSADYLPDMTMSGEGYPGRLNNNVPEIYNYYAQGDYLSLMNWNKNNGQAPNFVVRYYEAWKGIRIVNSFLENVDLITNSNEEEINGLKGQAYFLRAFFYHLLTKRHGGLIYLKNNLDLNEPLDRARETYASNYANIIEDVNLAIDLLPIRWKSENVGRPTKGAAMALKSRASLFAASPLVNTTNDKQAWIDAATAASDLINFANNNGLYALADASAAATLDVGHNGADLFVSEPEAMKPYRSIFVGPGISKVIPNEVIFMEVNQSIIAAGGFLHPEPRLALTVGFDIIKGNGGPMNIGATANFIAKYETKNGLAIEDDPSYNPQEPFINRDPRFYNDILFDGVPWKATSAGAVNKTGFTDLAFVNEQGKRGLDLVDPTIAGALLWKVRNTTGLRIRKWIPNGLNWRGGWNGDFDFHINNNIFRMAEIYLNYAEAANEAYGPGGVAPGASLSALDAVNKIRNRVGMPNVNATYAGSTDKLRERIRNERAIELAYEGHRYTDMRRWKTAHLDENQKVEFLEMRWQGEESSIYPTGFSYDYVDQADKRKTFTDRHYWWPIPSSESEVAPSFTQTTGW